MAYLKYSDLSLPKSNSDINHWVDHIEFFCLISMEGYINEQQIIDRILDENSDNPLQAVEEMMDVEEFDELLASVEDEDDVIEDEIFHEEDYNPVFNDRVVSAVNRYFDALNSRQTNFSEDYPFVVFNNEIRLKEDLTTSQTLYIILLCSSLLRLATRSGVNILGHYFEELCGPAFQKLTPVSTTNIFFGSGTTIGDFPSISGTFYNKILNLCELLHVEPATIFTVENAGKNNVGDGGLDWVGVLNFEDNESSQPTFFGQCACGADWVDKEFDAHISKWKNYIQFSNGYLLYHFVPRHFRDANLLWSNPLDIIDVVLIDRYRLISLLKTNENLEESLNNIYRSFLEELRTNKIDSFA